MKENEVKKPSGALRDVIGEMFNRWYRVNSNPKTQARHLRKRQKANGTHKRSTAVKRRLRYAKRFA